MLSEERACPQLATAQDRHFRHDMYSQRMIENDQITQQTVFHNRRRTAEGRGSEHLDRSDTSLASPRRGRDRAQGRASRPWDGSEQ